MTKDRALPSIGLTGQAEDWFDINWQTIRQRVSNLRQRIFRATQNGQWNKVRSLMKLMLRSYANLLSSVHKVTIENKGKRTPGVDNRLALTARARMKLARDMLKLKAWKVQPAVRLYIPKAGGKQRPLGILTIKNRVAQAIVKNALEPSWEARFETHSYGFRPGRSAHDAIEQCFNRLNKTKKDRWVLDADIRGAFDNISHNFILEKLGLVPGRKLIKEWLKAGYVEDEVLHDTTSGTQQGGVISPLLANVALDGMQSLLGQRSGFIRYADDFVVTARSREELESIMPTLRDWLAVRGLEMNGEKTKIVSIEDGFDFLGFNIKHYRGKCLIKPQKEKVLTLVRTISEWLKKHPSDETIGVIIHLNRILRGWSQYYKFAVSSQAFKYAASQIWAKIWKWCRRRHPKKNAAWVKRKYFRISNGQDWSFFAEGSAGVTYSLFNVANVRIQRHRKVQGAASPDDPSLLDYWIKRNSGRDEHFADADSAAHTVKKMLRA